VFLILGLATGQAVVYLTTEGKSPGFPENLPKLFSEPRLFPSATPSLIKSRLMI